MKVRQGRPPASRLCAPSFPTGRWRIPKAICKGHPIQVTELLCLSQSAPPASRIPLTLTHTHSTYQHSHITLMSTLTYTHLYSHMHTLISTYSCTCSFVLMPCPYCPFCLHPTHCPNGLFTACAKSPHLCPCHSRHPSQFP